MLLVALEELVLRSTKTLVSKQMSPAFFSAKSRINSIGLALIWFNVVSGYDKCIYITAGGYVIKDRNFCFRFAN